MYERIFDVYQKNNPEGGKDKNIMYFEPTQFPDVLGLGPNRYIINELGFESPPGA